jgi:hypothetical protein
LPALLRCSPHAFLRLSFAHLFADVAIYSTLWVLATENDAAVKKAIAASPQIQRIYDAVEKQENVAKYLAARKSTPM